MNEEIKENVFIYIHVHVKAVNVHCKASVKFTVIQLSIACNLAIKVYSSFEKEMAFLHRRKYKHITVLCVRFM